MLIYLLLAFVIGCVSGRASQLQYETLLDLMAHHSKETSFANYTSYQHFTNVTQEISDQPSRSVQRLGYHKNHPDSKMLQFSRKRRKMIRTNKLVNETDNGEERRSLTQPKISPCNRCSGQMSSWIPIVEGRKLQSARFDGKVIYRKMNFSMSPQSNFTVKTGVLSGGEGIKSRKYSGSVKSHYGGSEPSATTAASSSFKSFWYFLINPLLKLKELKKSWLLNLINGGDDGVSVTTSYKAPNKQPHNSKGNTKYGPPNTKNKTSYRPPPKRPSTSYGVPKIKDTSTLSASKNKPSSSYGAPNKRPSSSYGVPNKKPNLLHGAPTSKPKESQSTIEEAQKVEIISDALLGNELGNSGLLSGTCRGTNQLINRPSINQLQLANSASSQLRGNQFAATEKSGNVFLSAHISDNSRLQAPFGQNSAASREIFTDNTLYPPLTSASAIDSLQLSYGPLRDNTIKRNDKFISVHELSRLLQQPNYLKLSKEDSQKLPESFTKSTLTLSPIKPKEEQFNSQRFSQLASDFNDRKKYPLNRLISKLKRKILYFSS